MVVFLFFGGMVPSGAGSLLRWRSADGWSPCSNPCGPGIQVHAFLCLCTSCSQHRVYTHRLWAQL